MDKLLERVFERSIKILRQDKRCLGGWHFGSISRKQQDAFSDVDPVFLIQDEDFDAFDAEIPKLFDSISKDCILVWPEEFNSNDLRNYAVLIKGSDNSIVQYDFTVMNQSKVQNPFCKIWYKGCNEDSIIFDRYGDINRLLKTNTVEDSSYIDILHQIKKYWLFCFLSVKYYKRKDIFKLQSTMQDLFSIHSNLLLSIYLTESWGDLPTLVKNNIPLDKQANLLKYFCPSDVCNVKDNIIYVIEKFSHDISEICNIKGLKYDDFLEQSVKGYIEKNMQDLYI